MNTENTDKIELVYLEQWLETSRHYLFGDLKDIDVEGIPPPDLALSHHGAQDRFISRARGDLLRLVKRSTEQALDPLEELERTFHVQVAFIARRPDVPKRLLEWLSQGSNLRISRRIQRVMDHYESILCRMIGQAKQQGLIRADIEQHTAAKLFIGMIQSLVLRMNGGLRQRELLLREAVEVFTLYRASITS